MGPSLDQRTARMLGACLIVLLTVGAYLPAMNGGFVFDDAIYVTGDDDLATMDGLGRIWTEIGGDDYQHQYYPLTSSAFWVQRRLWGERPFGYHLVNVLLHAANALLLWRVLGLLKVPAAWVAGAIFAVHPVHVQSVAWITELKNVLSTCLFLLSVLVFLRWFEHRGARRYGLGLGLYAAALLSKTATCLLPAALLIARWWKTGRLTRRDLAAVAPLVVLGAAFAGMTLLLETSHGGAQGESFSHSPLERVLIAGRALWFYASKLAWPAGLTFVYPRWSIDAGAWWQYIFPLTALWTVAALWLWRDRLGRGPCAAAVYFAVAIIPLSVVNVAFTRLSFVADHWQYMASMGLIALAVGLGATVPWKIPAPRWIVAVPVIAVLAVLSWQRAAVFEGPRTLWRDTLARNPGAWVAHNNLAIALAAERRHDEAIEHYEQALALNPEFAKAHSNLAHSLIELGRLDEASRHLHAAIELDPDLAEAHYNLGNVLRAQDRAEAGMECYRRALEIDPRYAKAHNNLGAELLDQGRIEEAVAHFERVLEIDPGNPGALHNLELARRRRIGVAGQTQ